MTDLTPIVNAAIALIAALISAFLIPWLRRNSSAQDRDDLLQWVEIAVAAAEQAFSTSQGKAKKAYVLAFLQDKGFVVSEEELEAAIEAAVLKLHRELTA